MRKILESDFFIPLEGHGNRDNMAATMMPET
jgi:hypothetical protein